MDKVFESWLENQCEAGLALSAASDVLTLHSDPAGHPPRRFIARFDSPTLARNANTVTRAEGFAVLFHFPPDYLRAPRDAAQIVNLLTPVDAFHPNVAPPFICTGHITPGTGLCELIYRVYEILTFQKMTPREDDSLNHAACVWARRHMHMFPLSNAPLRRAAAAFSVEEIAPEERSDASQPN